MHFLSFPTVLGIKLDIFGVSIDTEVLTAFGGLTAAVVSWAGGYRNAKLKFKPNLKESDFKLQKDETAIKILGEPLVPERLIVVVQRSFEMVARKKGRYLFIRELEGATAKGKWDRCDLIFRGQPVAVKKSDDDAKVETVSPLRFQPGDSLIVRELTSREFINRYRGFYLLVINAVKGKTRIRVDIESNANLNGSVECYALSEDLNKIRITHNTDYAPIPESNSGIMYLVEWQKL